MNFPESVQSRERTLEVAKQNLVSNPNESYERTLPLVRQNPLDWEAYLILIEALYNSNLNSRAKELLVGAQQQFPNHLEFTQLGKRLHLLEEEQQPPSTNSNSMDLLRAKQMSFSSSTPKDLESAAIQLYSLYTLQNPGTLPSDEPFKQSWNYFIQEIRDGNLSPAIYVQLANLFFGKVSIQPTLREFGVFCLVKALESQPCDSRIWNSLHRLFPQNSGLLQQNQFWQAQSNIRKEMDDLVNRWAQGEFSQCIAEAKKMKSHGVCNPELDWHLIEWLAYHQPTQWEAEAQNLLQHWARFPEAHTPLSAQVGLQSFLHRNYAKAREILEQCVSKQENCLWLNVLAECHLKLENFALAKKYWIQSLTLEPEQSHLYFKLDQIHEVQGGIPKSSLSNKQVCILLYSWNKAHLLEETLLNLSQTNIGKATLLVLDNNSTDHMQTMLHTMKEKFPENPFRVITLPTNVGAPAARNWLRSQPEAKSADYICYLDDDVELPKEWLETLVYDLENNPDCGVAGFKINHPDPTHSLQYWGQLIGLVSPERISLSRKHENEPDFGQLNFKRKCVSVMGCCHLFTNEALYETGEFDIRFSPSQVDDIEHDYQLALKGYKAHYNGYLSVIHKQMSGKMVKKSRAAEGNVKGNIHKLALKHDTQKMVELKKTTDEFYWKSLQEARERVRVSHQLPPTACALF